MDRIGELVWEIINELKLAEKAEVECCGVTPYQGYMLMYLCDSGAVSMQQLADKMRVAVSTMTRNIDKLEKSGLVRRVKSERDARLSLVELTDEGRRIGEAVAGSWQSYFGRLSGCLDLSQKEKVIVGLETLVTGMRRAGCCCRE